MDGLTACASYPADIEQDETVDADTAEAVHERRSDLFTLLKNAARVASNDVHLFVRDRLQRVLSNSSATFQVSNFFPLDKSSHQICRMQWGRLSLPVCAYMHNAHFCICLLILSDARSCVKQCLDHADSTSAVRNAA